MSAMIAVAAWSVTAFAPVAIIPAAAINDNSAVVKFGAMNIEIIDRVP